MFFRRGVSDDGWLQVKVWLFTLGALVALVGMGLRNDWLIGAAGLLLAGGVLLRFVDRDADAHDDPGGRRPDRTHSRGEKTDGIGTGADAPDSTDPDR